MKLSVDRVPSHLQLAMLYLNQCEQLSDITPLKDIKTLKELTLPPGPKDLAPLRELPNLERLSFWQDLRNEMRPSKTTAEFWKRIDRLKAIGSDGIALKPSIPKEVMPLDEVRNHIEESVDGREAMTQRNLTHCFKEAR